MHFKPGDVLEYTGFNDQKLRYWRDTLRPLKRKTGNRRCYNHHEVVALIALDLLVKDLGCNIGTVKSLASQIFEHCKHESAWRQLAHYSLLIFPNEDKVELRRRDSLEIPLETDFFVVIQLAGPVTHLFSKLNNEEQQMAPPVPLLRARQTRANIRRRA